MRKLISFAIFVFFIFIAITPAYNANICFYKFDESSIPIDDSDLVSWGEFKWTDVKPGETVNGRFYIRNAGRVSDLYWEITEWPKWGIWDFGTFFPRMPPGGLWLVFLNMTAPNQGNKTFAGQIKVVNINNRSDFGIINASLTTCKKLSYSFSNNFLLNKELAIIKKFYLFLV
jgi:hypothetical protein